MWNGKMRDIIDERNERERISKSIVKSWNVNYVPVPPKTDEADDAAEEILDRLAEEAAEDEAEKRAQIDALIDEVRFREESYNEATGAYSGAYGIDGVEDEVTKGQIDKILHEKSDAIREIVEKGGE